MTVERVGVRSHGARHSASAARVLVVDELALVRAGIRALLSGVRDISVVGEVAPGGAVAAARRLLPDLVIVDPLTRDADGFALMRAIRVAAPDACLLVMTGSDEPETVVAAVAAGADGFLLNDAGRDSLLRAIRSLRAGQAVIDPDLAVRALRHGRRTGHAGVPPPLTVRELEVLQLLSRGQTNAQIARGLLVAVGTVKVHVEHILGKLGAADRTDAAVRAAGMGLLDEGPIGASPERPMPSDR